jgi:hypothetical protein
MPPRRNLRGRSGAAGRGTCAKRSVCACPHLFHDAVLGLLGWLPYDVEVGLRQPAV